MIIKFKLFENTNYVIGDRFKCIYSIAFFDKGDVGTLIKIEKIHEHYNVHVLMNKFGFNVNISSNIFEKCFIKIEKSKTFHELDPFGEEDWDN